MVGSLHSTRVYFISIKITQLSRKAFIILSIDVTVTIILHPYLHHLNSSVALVFLRTVDEKLAYKKFLISK